MSFKKYNILENTFNTQVQLQLPSIQTIKGSGIPLMEDNSIAEASNEDIKQRLDKLEGNIRMIEKKYRKNLKQGFDNKIKAFRIQAVIQRKVLQQKLLDASKTMEYQSQIQKITKVRRQKHRQYQFWSQIKQRKLQRQKRLKSLSYQQKNDIHTILKEKIEKIQQMNKQKHDQVIEEHQMSIKKRQYFQTIKKNLLKKQINNLKKQQIDSILTKTKILQKCKEELRQLSSKQTISDLSFITL